MDLESANDPNSIKIEITIPAPAVVKVPSRKVEPKQEVLLKDTTGAMQQKDEPGTLEKVRRHGSQLEKVAVNATQKFVRRGILVKDSRAS